MISRTYKLLPNPSWHPHDKALPVSVECVRNFEYLEFTFNVIEPPDCFRLECTKDGDPCWQDSCVEVFIASHNGYYNIETNAAGKSLAEFGSSRNGRRQFEPLEYYSLQRRVLMEPTARPDGQIQWVLQLRISNEKLQLSPVELVIGNLYKCGSMARIPTYLCAFKVDTPTPDFHRPEFFRNIFL